MNNKIIGIVFFTLTCASMLGALSGSALAGMSIGDAINKAGRQRMLSQRIAKAYFMAGQDILTGQAYDQLDGAIALFEKQLQELGEFVVTAEELAAHRKVVNLWEPYKSVVMMEPNKDSAQLVLDMSEKVLKRAHAVVGLLEKRSGTKAGYLVNLSGRQRMLTQRTSKFYVLRGWGMDSRENRKQYDKAVSEFSNALNGLKASPSNTPEISAKLKKVTGKWGMFKLTRKTGDDKFVPALVVRSLDGVLKLMNEVTGMYAELPDVALTPE